MGGWQAGCWKGLVSIRFERPGQAWTGARTRSSKLHSAGQVPLAQCDGGRRARVTGRSKDNDSLKPDGVIFERLKKGKQKDRKIVPIPSPHP